MEKIGEVQSGKSPPKWTSKRNFKIGEIMGKNGNLAVFQLLE